MSMDCNTVLGVTSLDSLFVFTESYLEGSLGLPNVSLATIFARDLVNHTSLFLLWNAVLQLHQGLNYITLIT